MLMQAADVVSAELVEVSVSGKALSMLVRAVEAEDDVQDDASSVGLPLFESTRLKASASDSRQDDNSEQDAVKDAAVHLLSGKRVSSVTADGYYYDICPSAVALLLRTQPSVLDQYNPAHVDGDGNCLFWAVSVALYGTQGYHENLRLLAGDEIRAFPEWYDGFRPDSLHPLRNVAGIVLVSLQDVLAEVEGAGRSCGVTAVLALSAVIGCPIHTFWPPLSGTLEPSPLSRVLVGRGVDPSKRPLKIMWSTTGAVPPVGPV